MILLFFDWFLFPLIKVTCSKKTKSKSSGIKSYDKNFRMSGMKKNQIGQDDLRRMMQKVKETGGQGQRMSTASNSKNKKYKLSSRELALLEEQKAKKVKHHLICT